MGGDIDLYKSLAFTRSPNRVSKISTSPLTTETLFTFTGTVAIVSITGKVIEAIENQATTVKLSVVCDALVAKDICANKDIDNFTVGSLISITGTLADAAVATTSVGVVGPGQASVVIATCISSGTITVTYGAASTGSIKWEVCYEPLSIDGNILAS